MRRLRTEQKFAFEKIGRAARRAVCRGPAQVWGSRNTATAAQSVSIALTFAGVHPVRRRGCAAELELLTSLADCGIEQYTRFCRGMQCAATEKKR